MVIGQIKISYQTNMKRYFLAFNYLKSVLLFFFTWKFLGKTVK